MKTKIDYKKIAAWAVVASVPVSLWAAQSAQFDDYVDIGYSSAMNSAGSYAGVFSVGWANDPSQVYDAALIGDLLISPRDCSLVVGTSNYFASSTPADERPVFTVANGGYNNVVDSNAFEVRYNGDVIVDKPQGDIPMGIYGN